MYPDDYRWPVHANFMTHINNPSGEMCYLSDSIPEAEQPRDAQYPEAETIIIHRRALLIGLLSSSVVALSHEPVKAAKKKTTKKKQAAPPKGRAFGSPNSPYKGRHGIGCCGGGGGR